MQSDGHSPKMDFHFSDFHGLSVQGPWECLIRGCMAGLEVTYAGRLSMQNHLNVLLPVW